MRLSEFEQYRPVWREYQRRNGRKRGASGLRCHTDQEKSVRLDTRWASVGGIVEHDDVELLAAYEFDRDESAFTRLVNRHSNWLIAAARRRLTDQHLAEDAVQAVFLILRGKSR